MIPRTLHDIESLVAESPVAAWLKLADGRFVTVSPAFAEGLGFAPADAERTFDQDFFGPNEIGRFRADDRRVDSSGKPRVFLEPPDSLTPAAWGATVKIPMPGVAGATAGFSYSVDTLLELEGLLDVVEARHSRSAETTVPDRLRRHLNRRFRTRIKVSDLADRFRRHPDYLGRSFHQSFGSTISDYVRARRVAWAARHLCRGRRPIAEIALEAGFYDQSHLTHAFRKVLGTTPARFRELSRPAPGFRRLASNRLPDALDHVRSALHTAGFRL